MSWAALLGPRRSQGDLAELRAAAIKDYDMGEMEFTCDKCIAKETCGWVFDLYNTDGDCIAEK